MFSFASLSIPGDQGTPFGDGEAPDPIERDARAVLLLISPGPIPYGIKNLRLLFLKK
jgi:hypothetical protein